jgi:hypothetical protein
MGGLLAVVAAIGALPVLAYLSVRKGDLAHVEIADDVLIVRPRGLNRVWALKGEVRVPLSRVSAVRTDVARRHVPSGFRVPGTYVPGVIQAGTYRKGGEKSFWLVGRTSTVTVIECPGTGFDRIVLQLPDKAVEELRRATRSGPSSRT